MEVAIPGKSVKLFSNMIRCLGKVGEELYLEAYADRVLMKTLNANRSAYFSFLLVPAFFESYHLSGARCTCKILLKPFQAAFKSLQNVERCVMSVFEEEAKLVLGMNCRLGVKKTFKLNIEDSNPISASYSKDDSLHRLIVRPKLFEDCIANFASSVVEMSMKFSRTAVHMKSSEDSQEDGASDPTKKSLLTELTLDVKDFEKYELEPGTDAFELIFSLRDVRPILQFCELATVPIQMYMMGSGQPLVLSVKMYNLFEADFVLATLQGSSNNSVHSSQASTQHAHASLHHARSATPHAMPQQQGAQSTPSSQSIQSASFPYSAAPLAAPHASNPLHKQAHPAASQNSQLHTTPPFQPPNVSQRSFQLEHSAPTQQMDVDGGGEHSMIASAGLWTEDVMRMAHRMDEDDDEAVQSDNE